MIVWLQDYHTGVAKAVLAKDMEHFGSPRQIRVMVHDARLQGYPICSGAFGYYYAESAQDVYGVLKLMEAQALAVSAVCDKFRDVYEQMKQRESTEGRGRRQGRLF